MPSEIDLDPTVMWLIETVIGPAIVTLVGAIGAALYARFLRFTGQKADEEALAAARSRLEEGARRFISAAALDLAEAVPSPSVRSALAADLVSYWLTTLPEALERTGAFGRRDALLAAAEKHVAAWFAERGDFDVVLHGASPDQGGDRPVAPQGGA